MQSSCDQELINTLQGLLKLAQCGAITGLAYVTLEPGCAFSGDVVGSARQIPLLTMGIVKALENKVAILTR